jgi:starvation-inducible DNA-binding protein
MSTTTSTATTEALGHLLADTYTLYLKTQNYHWNVTGPMFTTLHTLFETQYTELAEAVDEIAERIRALGERSPGSYAEFSKLASVQEAQGNPTAAQMVEHLVADQGLVRASAQRVLESAESGGDAVSADLATRRMEVAEKAAWMLRSHQE